MAGLTRVFPTLLNENLIVNPREDMVSNGILATVNGEVLISCAGCSNLTVLLTDTGTGTFVIEGSIDGANWVGAPYRIFSQNAFPPLLNTASAFANGLLVIAGVALFRFARIRAVTITGAVNVNMISGNSGISRFSDPELGSDRGGTTVGAAGAAVTLTIAAPGVGLRLYLASLQITRSASTALLPSATPQTITSTGITGNPAWTLGIAGDAIGVDRVINESFGPAVPGTALNTTMTIVAPAVAGAIIRITAKAYAGI